MGLYVRDGPVLCGRTFNLCSENFVLTFHRCLFAHQSSGQGLMVVSWHYRYRTLKCKTHTAIEGLAGRQPLCWTESVWVISQGYLPPQQLAARTTNHFVSQVSLVDLFLFVLCLTASNICIGLDRDEIRERSCHVQGLWPVSHSSSLLTIMCVIHCVLCVWFARLWGEWQCKGQELYPAVSTHMSGLHSNINSVKFCQIQAFRFSWCWVSRVGLLDFDTM